jgi:methylase of polypeptide subunit release factors
MLQTAGYEFITPTPLTISRVNGRAENILAKNLQDVFGWNRLFDKPLLCPAILECMENAGFLQESAEGWRSTVRASSIGERLYFHSAYPTSATDAVFFGPDTYRFIRQVSSYLSIHQPDVRRGVDIGCGSGAGAIEVALAYPEATIFALDINPAALTMTRSNAKLAGIANLVPVYSDMLGAVEGDFDLVIANPPYLVDAESRAYRHGGGDLGADLSLAVVQAAIERLSAGGTLLLYTASAIVQGFDSLRHGVIERLQDAGFHCTYEELDPDIFGEELEQSPYANVDRIAAVWLVATKPVQ